jgi:hypothetical protein
MASSGMLCRVALVRTDVSEELSASFIRVTRIGEKETLTVYSNRRTLRRNTLLASPILVTLMMEAPRSSETSGLPRYTRCNVPEDGILKSYRRENFNSYTVLILSYNLFIKFFTFILKSRRHKVFGNWIYFSNFLMLR